MADEHRLKVHSWVQQVFSVCGIQQPPSHLVQHYVDSMVKGSLSAEQIQREVLMLSGRAAPQQQEQQQQSQQQYHQQQAQPQALSRQPSGAAPQQQQPRGASLSTSASASASSSLLLPTSAAATAVVPPALPPSASLLGAPNISESAVTDEINRLRDEFGGGTNNSSEHKKMLREYAELLFVNLTGKKGDPASFNYVLQGLTDKSLTYTQAELFVKFSKEGKAYAKTRQAAQQTQHEAEKEAAKLARTQEYVMELFRVYAHDSHPPPSLVEEHVQSIMSGHESLQDVEDAVRLYSLAPPR